MYTGIKVDVSTRHRPAARQAARPWRGMRPTWHGFTLIEMMVVVAVIAIVVAIALPSYQESVRKSRRADAVLALQQIQVAQEQLRAECTSYAAGLAAARVCDAATPGNNRLALPANSADGYYTLALTGVTATGYTATATAVGLQADDAQCPNLVLQVAGAALTRTPAQCWTR
jgi:type IV pilus assembly protein PilE